MSWQEILAAIDIWTEIGVADLSCNYSVFWSNEQIKSTQIYKRNQLQMFLRLACSRAWVPPDCGRFYNTQFVFIVIDIWRAVDHGAYLAHVCMYGPSVNRWNPHFTGFWRMKKNDDQDCGESESQFLENLYMTFKSFFMVFFCFAYLRSKSCAVARVPWVFLNVWLWFLVALDSCGRVSSGESGNTHTHTQKWPKYSGNKRERTPFTFSANWWSRCSIPLKNCSWCTRGHVRHTLSERSRCLPSIRSVQNEIWCESNVTVD